MNYVKMSLTGVFVWICVSAAFYLSVLFDSINYNFNIKLLIVLLIMFLSATTGARFYYKNGTKTHGLLLGLGMSITAVLLDVLITVPFVEIPKGSSYQHFFVSPVIWILVVFNTATVYGYWKLKIKPKK
ncbi:DUF5367 family protein [Flavobacterium sp. CLA17]|uniref:DUF5367 family protein n=1 Tax=Flavobacterium sp. CLA17 TaxID=2724135 RepID=UPI001490FBF1|nr:DUF5367 family protein [Flavobacterium sp. CLA17]QSB25650.1 DUF5367 family protein [Flavobacterium sp. CLA17]